MAHRLVDGEPEVGGVDDEVVGPGLDRRRRHLLGQEHGECLELGVPVPAPCRGVLPAPADRGRQGPHRLERARCGVHGHRLDDGVDAHPALRRDGARQIGVVLVLHDREHPRRDVVDDLGRQEPARPVLEEGHLVGERHGRGVHVVGRRPGDGAVGGLVGHLDAGAQRRGRLGRQPRGVVGEVRRRVRVQLDRRGEADGAVAHDVETDAELGVVDGGLDVTVTQRHELRPDPLDPDLGVTAPERGGPLQRGGAHLVERETLQTRAGRWQLRALSRPRRPGRGSCRPR